MDLLTAYDTEFLGEPDYSAEDLRDDWHRTNVVLERDARVVRAPDGSMAAYLWCWAKDPAALLVSSGTVARAHRGIGLGSLLIDRAEAWARRWGDEHVLQNVILAADEGAAALLLARGYELVRHFWRMERSLEGFEGAGPVPDGFTIRGFEPARDAALVHRVLEDAFAGHWRTVPFAYDEWARTYMEGPGFDASLWFVAEDGEGAAGVAIGRAYPDEGWVSALGVRSRARGRGVGRALLLCAFEAFARAGLPAAALSVDAGNQTGATRLYESAGMRVALQTDFYERTIAR